MADRFGYGEIGLDIHPCRGCEDYDAPDGCKSNGGCGMTQTNADRIRAMTDEELMEFLEHDYWSIDYCKKDAPIDQETKECLLPSCKQCWLEWLKQEADG